MQQVGKSNHNEERNSTFKINPSTKIGYVSLNVSDIQSSLEFYQSMLGFRLIQKKSAADRVYLSSGETQSSFPILELVQTSQTDSNLASSRRSGLYHFAILLPERKNLSDVLLYLSEKQDKIHFDGLADHLVSESIYIRDPDFIGIEIYSDRPQSEWKWNDDENDNRNNNNNNNNNNTDGQLQMATL